MLYSYMIFNLKFVLFEFSTRQQGAVLRTKDLFNLLKSRIIERDLYTSALQINPMAERELCL